MEEEEEAPLHNVESAEVAAELEELLRSEAIGSTLYDKRWVISAVMKLVMAYKEEEESKESKESGVEESSKSDSGYIIDKDGDKDSIVDLLTTVTQIAKDPDVAQFLIESDCLRLLSLLANSTNDAKATLAVQLLSNALGSSQDNLLRVVASNEGLSMLNALLEVFMSGGNAGQLTEAAKCLQKAFSGLERLLNDLDESGDSDESDKHPLLGMIMADERLPMRITMLFECALNPDLIRALAAMLNGMLDLLLEHTDEEKFFQTDYYKSPQLSLAVANALKTAVDSASESAAISLMEVLGKQGPVMTADLAETMCSSVAAYVRMYGLGHQSVGVAARVITDCWKVLGRVHEESNAALKDFVEEAKTSDGDLIEQAAIVKKLLAKSSL